MRDKGTKILFSTFSTKSEIKSSCLVCVCKFHLFIGHLKNSSLVRVAGETACVKDQNKNIFSTLSKQYNLSLSLSYLFTAFIHPQATRRTNRQALVVFLREAVCVKDKESNRFSTFSTNHNVIFSCFVDDISRLLHV